MAAAAIVSCKSEGSKVLVLYYSQTGATEAVASELARQLNADVATFDVENPYDGTYDETIQRCLSERGTGELSKLAPLSVDINKYDVIFLGYPVWFGTCARPVFSLAKEVSFEGKTVVPFCSFGSGGLNTSTADLKAALPKADIREGYGVRNARVGKIVPEITKFLIKSGWVEGSVPADEAFSAQAPVGEEEVSVFDAACSSYPMPLGSPVTAAKRAVNGGVEYLFVTESSSADGSVSTSQIYVLCEEGSQPEFTQVVR